MKLFLYTLIASLMLVISGCAGSGAPSSAGNPPFIGNEYRTELYQAHATYNIVLRRAVAYSESAQADPDIVAALAQVNSETVNALKYAHAFIVCDPTGKKGTLDIIASVNCGDFAFTAANVISNTTVLKTATKSIVAILQKKGITLPWATSQNSYPSHSSWQTLQFSRFRKVEKPSLNIASFGASWNSSNAKAGTRRTKNSRRSWPKPMIYRSA
jgi:hypothetical protein